MEEEARKEKRCKDGKATIRSFFESRSQTVGQDKEPQKNESEKDKEVNIENNSGNDCDSDEDIEFEIESEEEKCEATICRIDESNESRFQWVQCKNCESWWHKFCAEVLDARKTFYCKNCSID